MHLVYVFFLEDESLAEKYIGNWKSKMYMTSDTHFIKIKLLCTPLGHTLIYKVLSERYHEWKDADLISLFSCEELVNELSVSAEILDNIWLITATMCKNADCVGVIGSKFKRYYWCVSLLDHIIITHGFDAFEASLYFLQEMTTYKDESIIAEKTHDTPIVCKNSMTIRPRVFEKYIIPFLHALENIKDEKSTRGTHIRASSWSPYGPPEKRKSVQAILLEYIPCVLMLLQDVQVQTLMCGLKPA